MGVDVHALKFMHHAAKRGPFGACLTAGRQNINIAHDQLRALLKGDAPWIGDSYCERLLMARFGASSVDSLDMSDFEGASLIHDLNRPVPAALCDRFDTVIDLGTSEHIFNVPQALANLSAMVRRGGQIIHVLPANNWCGHGFWQFSPALFHALYTPGNGYRETEVYLADTTDTTQWIPAERPKPGHRQDVTSSVPLHVMVRTVRDAATVSHDDVQQGDYVEAWTRSERSRT